MELLKVHNHQIVTAKNKPMRLRGWNIGGWLNMEDFIDGFVGAKIALDVAGDQLRARGVALDDTASRAFVQRFVDWLRTLSHGATSPLGQPGDSNSSGKKIGRR